MPADRILRDGKKHKGDSPLDFFKEHPSVFRRTEGKNKEMKKRFIKALLAVGQWSKREKQFVNIAAPTKEQEKQNWKKTIAAAFRKAEGAAINYSSVWQAFRKDVKRRDLEGVESQLFKQLQSQPAHRKPIKRWFVDDHNASIVLAGAWEQAARQSGVDITKKKPTRDKERWHIIDHYIQEMMRPVKRFAPWHRTKRGQRTRHVVALFKMYLDQRSAGKPFKAIEASMRQLQKSKTKEFADIIATRDTQRRKTLALRK